jgi:ketosteroid isomerase-like protein
MTDTKIETIQRVYEAFGRGDVEAILAQVTDDVDWASVAESPVGPWHGVHKGKAEVMLFFKDLGETLEVTEFTPLSFGSNDTDVFVVIRFGFNVRANGRHGSMEIHHWWRFTDGLISMYRGTEDTNVTRELLAS